MALSDEYTELPVSTIYYDRVFNCRGEFTPQSCLDLAQSIRQHGLQFPVVVQPVVDVEDGLPEGYDYRLIVGHRRFTAITQLLEWETIAVQIKRNLTERQARVLNLIENLERKDLTLLDEARAFHAIFPEGTTLQTMARETSKSVTWCNIHWKIPTLPEEIQQDCAAGRLSTTDIGLILALKNEKHQIARARELKAAKAAGETVRQRMRRYGHFRRARSRKDIHAMLAYLMAGELKSHTYRALAWAAGDLTKEEFLK